MTILTPGLKSAKDYSRVLILAGTELNFFMVACMGLCCGFVLKTMLMTEGCFCYY